MMVTFVSQCEKKALNRTRRVLDAFADRIGDNTWQTVITQEGLLAVKKLLRKTATKNTAVSCHWVRSRSRTELVWLVGNKSKFNGLGLVPVNSTTVNRTYRDDRADWKYLPLIQSLVSLAALLHDWGKASARFQEKLSQEYKGKYGDALRHEWISCLLLKALICKTDSESDSGWLTQLAEGEINEEALKQTDLLKFRRPLAELPQTAKLVAWLILTHHRLPLQTLKPSILLNEWCGVATETMDDLFAYITQDWSYENRFDGYDQQLKDCLHFPKGLISNSQPWLKELKRWAKKLLGQQELVAQIMQDGSYRTVLHHARLCLMLGDHYYSSLTLKESGEWRNTTGLVANTQKGGSPKQSLDQHLVGVYRQALRNVYKLPVLEQALPDSDNIAELRKKSPAEYRWQDRAASKIQEWVKASNETKHGFFAVNMASTGSGKTFANAKAMLALSENQDSLRYILALGLRTLTLQTGDEYRERIFKNTDGSDLAVLIGSKAVAELHAQAKEQAEGDTTTEQGSESQESLLGNSDEVIFDSDTPEDGLATLLQTQRDRAFLYAPILTCTIDHIMAATETTRGGRYILPSLRLMSSDLVIDEIDDFTGSDLIAIGRLIHLAGMLGRKVMISSATIPPSLAEGYFNCYQRGWQLYCQTRNASQVIGCAWIDEFTTHIVNNSAQNAVQANQEYAAAHSIFIEKRVAALCKQQAKRKANIIDCQMILELEASGKGDIETTRQTGYFETIFQDALIKHHQHHQTDQATDLKVSFGVVRMANISPCIALTRYLLECPLPTDTAIRVMPYHSQQVMLLRHEQERHLDAVLKYKEKLGEKAEAFKNVLIREHLDSLSNQSEPPKNVVFILIATPVEEVGRDHDFDWAIVEPSSYRSIVQLAGRVRRHRSGAVQTSNVGLLQYNWKTIKSGDKKHACYFCMPGYEFNGQIKVNGRERSASCEVHDLRILVNEKSVAERLDAIPRIDENPPKGFGLARLEHAVTAHWLKQYDAKGPETLQGYLSQNWFMTALPQALNRFRQSRASIHLYRCFDDKGHCYFTEKDNKGKAAFTVAGDLINQDDCYRIQNMELSDQQRQRFWLFRDYRSLLEVQAEQKEISLNTAALRYGEVVIQEPYENQSPPNYIYDDQFGLFKDERR